VPAYRRLRMPRKRPEVLGADLNRSEIEASGSVPVNERHTASTRIVLVMTGRSSASASAAFFYDAAFTHTMMRGLVAASLGQVAVLSLIRVTGVLRGPQYPITNTSFWLHSPRHAAAVQSRRITRMAFSAAPGGPAGPSVP
jgi:hypothetical protein